MAGLKTLKFKYFSLRKTVRLIGIPFNITEMAFLKALMLPCYHCQSPGSLSGSVGLLKPTDGFTVGNMKQVCQPCYTEHY